jgi:hypothetical protein
MIRRITHETIPTMTTILTVRKNIFSSSMINPRIGIKISPMEKIAVPNKMPGIPMADSIG